MQSQEDIDFSTKNLNEARKEKEELGKYNQSQKFPESSLDYLNELLNIQISNKEHNDINTDSVTRIQDEKDTIKNDNDLNDAKDLGVSTDEENIKI